MINNAYNKLHDPNYTQAGMQSLLYQLLIITLVHYYVSAFISSKISHDLYDITFTQCGCSVAPLVTIGVSGAVEITYLYLHYVQVIVKYGEYCQINFPCISSGQKYNKHRSKIKTIYA